jgi:hypothetical protein
MPMCIYAYMRYAYLVGHLQSRPRVITLLGEEVSARVSASAVQAQICFYVFWLLYILLCVLVCFLRIIRIRYDCVVP